MALVGKSLPTGLAHGPYGATCLFVSYLHGRGGDSIIKIPPAKRAGTFQGLLVLK